MKGNMDSLTATCLILISSRNPKSLSLYPTINLAAIFASGTPTALLTNGTVLLALGLASII